MSGVMKSAVTRAGTVGAAGGPCTRSESRRLAPNATPGGDLRLLEAVKRRDQKAVTALLRAKADVNAAQPDGATALAWAVHLGEREMAEALLDAGANVNTADEYGETPLTLAAANGDAAAHASDC